MAERKDGIAVRFDQESNRFHVLHEMLEQLDRPRAKSTYGSRIRIQMCGRGQDKLLHTSPSRFDSLRMQVIKMGKAVNESAQIAGRLV